MEKNKLLLFPFFAGLILMVYSWYLSYPLSADSVDDFVFNHVSILYWFSLPLLLTSMYMMAVTFKNNTFKWIISVGIVTTLYSISYFYFMMPGSDSQYFRGLTEYFIETENLDPLQLKYGYYQWPSFFILSYVASSVSGLTLVNFEFLLYTVIGFLLATSLHVYASRAYKNGGFLTVAAFFTSMFYFLNYQCVPFSLALGLLFLLFMLETQQKSIGLTITIIVLFTGITITHAFVPLFFVLYLLMRTILERNRHHRNLFLFTLILFFIIQFTFAQYSFARNILRVMTWSSEYSNIVESTIAPASVPIDVIAQMFSRAVTIAFIMICGVGFMFLLIKRKLRTLDKALLLTGVFYSGFGIFLYSLGSRAIILAFVPVSLGAAWLFESKFRPYLKYIFSVLLIVLLMLFSFIPLHLSFFNYIQFQTLEAYRADNFLIEYYNWEKPSSIFTDFRVITYLQSKLGIYTHLTPYLQTGREADTIFYTVGLGKYLLSKNYTMERIFCEERLNVVYNNGFSYLAIKAQD